MFEQLSETVLQQLQPIAALPVARRGQLFQQTELQSLHKGDYLFRAGDDDSRIHYLIEGRIELRDGQGQRSVIGAGHELPLAALRPRTAGARALADSTVLHCSREWFDACLLPPLLRPLPASAGDAEPDSADWLQRLMAFPLYQSLPAANLQQIFSQCEALALGHGQTVINQGLHDGGFYIIQSGHCVVHHEDKQGQSTATVATLGPGDWFNEVSLISGCPSAVSVTMQGDGALLRLEHRAFRELIQDALIDTLDSSQLQQLPHDGVRWLDVREKAEAEADPLEGARHIAFSQLLSAPAELDDRHQYVIVCDSGARSIVATLLLVLHGYAVSWLRGGLLAARGHERAADDSESVTLNNAGDPLLQSLRNELTGLLRQVDNAMRLKRDAEAARRQAERAAMTQMHAERERLQQQAQQVQTMLEQTRQLKQRLMEEKQRLYANVREREQAMERRIANLNLQVEQRAGEERERLEDQYEQQASAIEQLHSEKKLAESKLTAISTPGDGGADDDKAAGRAALEAEFEQFSRDLHVSRDEHSRAAAAAHELAAELGNELAPQDGEFSEYQVSRDRLNRQRGDLEADARELSATVEQSLIDKQASKAACEALENDLANISTDDEEQHRQTEAALRAARARHEEAEQAYASALNAQQENAAALANTEQAEAQLLQDMNAEIESWLEEQARQTRSPRQEALIKRYEETMERMQRQASEAEEMERTRDDLLVSDINAELATIADQRSKRAGNK